MGAVSGSRFIVGAKSPLTGAIACSTSSLDKALVEKRLEEPMGEPE